jgi:PKD repeat protein
VDEIEVYDTLTDSWEVITEIPTSRGWYPGAGVVNNDIYVIGSHDLGINEMYDVDYVNSPPQADANGPYIGSEGSQITFDASGSSDPDDDELQYRWDLDFDGTWDTPYSSDPTSSRMWLDDYSGIVKVEVFDGHLTDTDTASVTVNNLPPMSSIDDVIQPFPGFILSGDVLEFHGSYTDTGTLDSHITEWDFGDETVLAGTSTPTHAYASAGMYTVTFTVTDDDGGAGTATTMVTVLSEDDATETIVTDIEDLNLDDGPETSLISKLENALKSILNDRPSAEGQLGAFINEIEAQRGKELTEAQADYLIAAAQNIIDNL